MINFNICYPDANTFSSVIRLKKLKSWQTQYIKLDKDIGYWVTESPFEDDGFELFRDLIAKFPIQKNNNDPNNFDPNPFDTIHVPEWIYKDLCFLIKDFYLQHTQTPIIDPQIHEWGNVYYREKAKPISCWRIPHIDYVHGMVANLWFTNLEPTHSSTKLYRYTGNMHGEIYDFQINEHHKMHQEWKEMAENPIRTASWFNMSDSELGRWGFEYLGEAPTKEKTMTMYHSNICHSAYIDNTVDFRWSHAFAFSHLLPKDTLLKEIFL
jgi:hypothetical protein